MKKKSLVLSISIVFTIVLSLIIHIFKYNSPSSELKISKDYYMVTFLSGIEYWKGSYSGFSEKGKELGVNTFFTGSTQYDINQEVTILEQIISNKKRKRKRRQENNTGGDFRGEKIKEKSEKKKKKK